MGDIALVEGLQERVTIVMLLVGKDVVGAVCLRLLQLRSLELKSKQVIVFLLKVVFVNVRLICFDSRVHRKPRPVKTRNWV